MPADVRGKILDFVQCGLAAALMRGKAYLSMGGTSMGIAGSMVDYAFWEKWLGMRVEDIDMTEFVGRMQKGQFDPEEYERATVWVKEHCVEGEDYNSQETQRSRQQIDSEWSDSVKMSLIARDLMVGNPQLAKMGLEEQAQGHGAIASGFQGQRQWTDHFPNGDFLEAILNTSFDWNGKRSPYIVATENDALNAATMPPISRATCIKSKQSSEINNPQLNAKKTAVNFLEGWQIAPNPAAISADTIATKAQTIASKVVPPCVRDGSRTRNKNS